MNEMAPSKPTGTFLDDARWNPDRMTVDFTLWLRTDDGEQYITYRVSIEALEDCARTSGEVDPMKLFKRFYPKITAVLDRKLKAGMFAVDGSILVVSGDF